MLLFETAKKNHWFILPFIVVSILLGILLVSTKNRELFMAINSISEKTGTDFWARATFFGDTMVAMLLLFPLVRKRPDIIKALIIATLFVAPCVGIIKPWLNVPRPVAVLGIDAINVIGPALKSRSFPSGHATTIFTLVGVLIFMVKNMQLRIALFIASLIVGISRCAVGVHWPIDVLAGFLFGWTAAFLGVYFAGKTDNMTGYRAQMVYGSIFTVVALLFISVYDIRYKQAESLQFIGGILILLVGMREFSRIIMDKKELIRQQKIPNDS